MSPDRRATALPVVTARSGVDLSSSSGLPVQQDPRDRRWAFPVDSLPGRRPRVRVLHLREARGMLVGAEIRERF